MLEKIICHPLRGGFFVSFFVGVDLSNMGCKMSF
jgi:hypothetical protein